MDRLATESISDSTFVINLFDARNDTAGITGFRSNFVDREGGSPNQARHTAGAISFGFAGGVAALPGGRVTFEVALQLTLNTFNERERSYRTELVPTFVPGGATSRQVPLPLTQSQQADINLNAVAVPIGFALGVGEISRHDIGRLIRSSICGS